MTSYDMYGSDLGLRALADRVAAVLGIAFERRDSDARGGAYYRAQTPSGEVFRVLTNLADDPDDVPEPEHPDVVTLLEVSTTERAAELASRLAAIDGLRLLWHRER